jgi:tetratricopeptide (TPR) repeat protein
VKPCLLVLVILLTSAPVLADGPDDARELNRRGSLAYNLQQWDLALEDFTAAYGAEPDPAFLFNIAQCQRQLGKYAAAAKSYRLYLAQAADGPERDHARRLALQMDDAARSSAPRESHRAEQLPAAVASPAPAAPTPPAVVKRRRWRPRPIGLILGGAGLALAGIGAVLLVEMNQSDRSAREATSLPDLQSRWSARNAFEGGGIATLTVGAAGIVVGGILLGVLR